MRNYLKLLHLIYICERRYVKLAHRYLNKFNKYKDKNEHKAYMYAWLTDMYIRKGEACADEIDKLFKKED